MFTNSKNVAISVAFVLILASTLTLNIQPQQHDVIAKENIYFFYEKASGSSYAEGHNVITNIGENRTGQFHSQNTTSENGVLWISIGNATASASLTQLTSEYLRWEGTAVEWMNGGDFAYNLTYTHMFTETQNIDCAGSHWDGSGNNNLYAVANLAGGAQTFNANDNITITWVKTFDCND